MEEIGFFFILDVMIWELISMLAFIYAGGVVIIIAYLIMRPHYIQKYANAEGMPAFRTAGVAVSVVEGEEDGWPEDEAELETEDWQDDEIEDEYVTEKIEPDEIKEEEVQEEIALVKKALNVPVVVEASQPEREPLTETQAKVESAEKKKGWHPPLLVKFVLIAVLLYFAISGYLQHQDADEQLKRLTNPPEIIIQETEPVGASNNVQPEVAMPNSTPEEQPKEEGALVVEAQVEDIKPESSEPQKVNNVNVALGGPKRTKQMSNRGYVSVIRFAYIYSDAVQWPSNDQIIKEGNSLKHFSKGDRIFYYDTSKLFLDVEYKNSEGKNKKGKILIEDTDFGFEHD